MFSITFHSFLQSQLSHALELVGHLDIKCLDNKKNISNRTCMTFFKSTLSENQTLRSLLLPKIKSLSEFA